MRHKDGFTRRIAECPICGHARCVATEDGSAVWCYRENRATRIDPAEREALLARSRAQGPGSGPGRKQRESDDLLDRTYRALLENLPLTEQHRADLLARGLDPNRAGPWCRSLVPDGHPDRGQVEQAFLRAREAAGGKDVPLVMPARGLASLDSDWSSFGSALLIPVLSAGGRVVGLRVRLDDPPKGKGRYRWGTGASARIHVAVPPALGTRNVWLTEGELKAEVAAHHLGAHVISLPGVASCHHQALAIVKQLATEDWGGSVVVAFDSDAATNKHVFAARATLLARLEAEGVPVLVATWDQADGKGLDDLLLTGKRPKLEPVSESRHLTLPEDRVPEVGRTPRFPTYAERVFLARAARHQTDATALNNMLAASLCGVFTNRIECVDHGVLEGEEQLVCERPTCLHFSIKHAHDQLEVVKARWPKELALGKLALENLIDPPKANDEARARIRRAVGKTARAQGRSKADAKRAVAALGFYATPGALWVVSAEPEDLDLLRAVPGLASAERAGRKRRDELMEECFYARSDRLRGFYARRDDKAFGSDPWCGRVVAPTGGHVWNELVGWPTQEELRHTAKTTKRTRVARHCGGRLRHVVVYTATGEVFTSRLDKAWRVHDLLPVIEDAWEEDRVDREREERMAATLASA